MAVMTMYTYQAIRFITLIPAKNEHFLPGLKPARKQIRDIFYGTKEVAGAGTPVLTTLVKYSGVFLQVPAVARVLRGIVLLQADITMRITNGIFLLE